MRKFIAWSLLIVGALLGVVWYFDINQTGESWGDALSDPLGLLQDLFQRGVATVKGSLSNDPTVIAAGLISGFEGFVGHSYQDVAGIWTIGYGHKIVDGDGFDKDASQLILQPDAFALLQADLDTVVNCVNNAVKVACTPQQLAALYSFTYNVGCGAFEESTLLRQLNAGNFDAAASEFSRWTHAGGSIVSALVTRRASEADLFSSASSTSTDIKPTDTSDGENS